MAKEENELVDELDNLDKSDEVNDGDDPNDGDTLEDDPQLSIVDKFVDGDMDGVKSDIHDQVVKIVSDVVNTKPE